MNVKPTADTNEIKAAYKKIMDEESESNNQNIDSIKKAYSILSDVTLRRSYDFTMGFRDEKSYEKPYTKVKDDEF